MEMFQLRNIIVDDNLIHIKFVIKYHDLPKGSYHDSIHIKFVINLLHNNLLNVT